MPSPQGNYTGRFTARSSIHEQEEVSGGSLPALGGRGDSFPE